MRSYGLDDVTEKIRAAGGEIYAITSEPHRLAAQAQLEWELDFETVADPHHEISKACHEAGFLKVIVNTNTARFEEDENSPYRHPKGYFQPGVLAVSRDGRILYRWRSLPKRENMGGATNRPTASYVARKIFQALDHDSALGAPADAELDMDPEVDSRGMPWPLFAPLLVANGWFLRPNTFGQAVGGLTAAERMKRAGLRIPFFIAAWVAAFLLLPKTGVLLALAAWIGWIAPQLLAISRQFQPKLTDD